MGSDSDLPTMQEASKILTEFGVPFEVRVCSAHRTPDLLFEYAAGARERGHNVKKAEKLFELMEQFAGYGFNKSHSTAYALLAYQTAYLKSHYPVEFMAALLTSEKGNRDKVIKHISVCKEMGINVLPPDINQSVLDFSVDGGNIRFGLAAVKNVGESAIESIIESRDKDGSFKSFLDFCSRVDLRKINKRVVESLIKCGAFDGTGAGRAAMDAAIARPRTSLSPYAPRIITFKIPTDKIREVIGPGGKVIRGIVEQTGNDGGHIGLQRTQHARYGDGVLQIRLPGTSQLTFMRLRRKIVGFAQDPEIRVFVIVDFCHETNPFLIAYIPIRHDGGSSATGACSSSPF